MGRVALVSGASRGIGAEIARQLASDHGFLVLAGARETDDVEAGERITPVELDVTDQASVDAARERIESDPGRLDVLVNNAGVYGAHDPVAEYDLDEAHRVLEVNTFGALRLAQAMLPLLRASGDARIVNVSSGAGQLDDMNGGSIGYRMSKTALNAITRVLAAEEEGIRTNSICPGWVATDMGGKSAPRSVAEGADTAVWLAADHDVGSGGFFRNHEPIPW
ncbi:MAG: SDR family NAD(P)-dependent oxidoreductase [Actinomycetota bacterium]|nr:SDR family NAD(P)-dependent oxidoreductase [Actinomycetota bacterium]